jgi:hypothetical protein
MTPKNAFGSMPCADVKSVPVFFSDRMAAAMPWYAATQDTREKTAKMMSVRFRTDACGDTH